MTDFAPARTRLWCTGAACSDGAGAFFETLLGHIGSARRRIQIHMYVWRSDTIGNRIGRALLEAADRGVEIHITKDLGACLFERVEMNRKSFFDGPVSGWKELSYRLLRPTFPRTYVEDAFDGSLGRAVMDHPGIAVEWIHTTHTKYYLFDDHTLLIGSVNIEDRHRGYFDYMLELSGPETVDRFRRRLAGEPAPEPVSGPQPEFVLNTWGQRRPAFEIKPCVLSLLNNATRSAYIEMAYLGDPDATQAVITAAGRGVEVTLLCSREANVGNDINLKTMHQLYRSGCVAMFLTPKMIHSKMMLIDDEILLLGSANFSVFSLQKAGELDVLIRENPELIREIRAEADARKAVSEAVGESSTLPPYNRAIAALQQAFQKVNPN